MHGNISIFIVILQYFVPSFTSVMQIEGLYNIFYNPNILVTVML